MISIGSLNIRGHFFRRVPNHFFRQKVESDALCVLFGGWQYTTDMPLFYYTRKIFTGLGFDVLAVDFQYASSRYYARLPDRKRQEWFLEEVRSAFTTANQKRYRRVVLGAKGIGTMALVHLGIENLIAPETRLIWLSPLLDAESIRETLVSCPHSSLVVVGKRDPQLNQQLEKKLAGNKNLDVLALDDANDDLELAGNAAGSIQLVSGYVDELRRFLGIAPERKSERKPVRRTRRTTKK